MRSSKELDRRTLLTQQPTPTSDVGHPQMSEVRPHDPQDSPHSPAAQGPPSPQPRNRNRGSAGPGTRAPGPSWLVRCPDPRRPRGGGRRLEAGPPTGASVSLATPHPFTPQVTGSCAGGSEASWGWGTNARTEPPQQLLQDAQPQVTQRLLGTAESDLRPLPAAAAGSLHAVHCGDRQRGSQSAAPGPTAHAGTPLGPRATSRALGRRPASPFF